MNIMISEMNNVKLMHMKDIDICASKVVGLLFDNIVWTKLHCQSKAICFNVFRLDVEKLFYPKVMHVHFLLLKGHDWVAQVKGTVSDQF